MPGILVDHQIQRLREGAKPSIVVAEECINTSSFDLPLGKTIYQVASEPVICPKGFSFEQFVNDFRLNTIDISSEYATLTPGSVYIAELDCNLNLPSAISGRTNPKSTTGRNGVDTKVITDGGTGFTSVTNGYQGTLYVAITPDVFPYQVKTGERLVQLRLIDEQRVILRSFELEHLHRNNPLAVGVKKIDFSDDGLSLHLSLAGNPSNLMAKNMGRPIPSWEKELLDPKDFFENKNLYQKNLFVEPGAFLLAKTQELVRTPIDLCAELDRIDESGGDISLHDAGFIDPGFGLVDDPNSGSTVVLEVTNFGKSAIQLTEGRRTGILKFERLAGVPTNPYGSTQIGGVSSSYQGQREIRPAKQFKAWQ